MRSMKARKRLAAMLPPSVMGSSLPGLEVCPWRQNGPLEARAAISAAEISGAGGAFQRLSPEAVPEPSQLTHVN